MKYFFLSSHIRHNLPRTKYWLQLLCDANLAMSGEVGAASFIDIFSLCVL